MVPGGPFYTGGDFPDFSSTSTSTFPVSVPIPATAANDVSSFENAFRQQQHHHDDQLAVLGVAAAPPHPNLFGQINNSNNTSTLLSPQSDPSKDMIMISRQNWIQALSEGSQAKKERDELRLQLAAVRNELYTAKRAQKQLRMELDEVKVAAKTLRRQSTTLAETQKRLRKERNEARIKVAMLSKVVPREHAAAVLKGVGGGGGVDGIPGNKSRDPLALLLGQAPAATPIADNTAAARRGSIQTPALNNNMQGGSGLLLPGPQTQPEPNTSNQGHGQNNNNTQWQLDGGGGAGGEGILLEATMAMDESPENPDNDEDQRLIDAFLAETSGNSGGELSPEQAGFSPTTMAELFRGGVDIT